MRITLIVACMLGAVALGRKNLALKKEAKKALMNKRRAARTMQEDDYLKKNVFIQIDMGEYARAALELLRRGFLSLRVWH